MLSYDLQPHQLERQSHLVDGDGLGRPELLELHILTFRGPENHDPKLYSMKFESLETLLPLSKGL